MTVTKLFSLEEVSKNNGKNGSRVWVIIRRNIYDVTNYMDKHPGGPELIEEWAGKDATKAFEDMGHSDDAEKIMRAYKIGELIKSDKEKSKSGKKIVGKSKNSQNYVNGKIISKITCGLLR